MFDRVVSMASWGLRWALYALSFLGRAIPKDEQLWVFGADGGNRFADNSKYLFLYAANEREAIRPVWLTNNPETRDQLRRAGYESYLDTSLRGLYLTVRARYAFVVLGRADIAWWMSGATTVVNLWHGCPLKRIGSDIQGQEFSREGKFIFDIRDSAFDRFVTTADSLRSIFAGTYNLDLRDVLALGYPRNDVLKQDVAGATVGVDEEIIEMVEERAEEGPVIAYMPTYRSGFGMGHGGGEGPPIDPEALESMLAPHDATFLLKLHPHEQDAIDAGDEDRIVELPAEFDIYPVLSAVDVLVTDYSSVYFDYLHVDNPVVFYPYDLDAYRERPGFYFDYDEVTPGPTPETFEGFVDALERTITGPDEYVAERARVRNEFFDDPDTRAAERVYDHFRR